jgi:PPP family 3-phenylpropionic acid transporter
VALPAFLLSGLYFGYYAFVGAYLPYFALYLASLGLLPWQIGVLLSLGQFTRVFAPNVWALLADRYGNTLFLLRLAFALAVLAFCGLFGVRGFYALMAVLAVHSFFASAAMPLFEAMTLNHLRGQYARYGLIRLWGSIGFIIAVTVIGWSLDRVSIDNLLWMIALPLCGALLFAFVLKAPARIAYASAEPIWQIARRPEIAALLAAGFLMCVAHGPLYAFYSIYLDATGYSKTLVGALWSLGVIAEIVIFLAMPHWLMRFTPRSILLASFALATLRFSLIGWGVEHLMVLVFAQLLHAASFGSFHAAALAVVNESFTGARHVRGQALFSSLTYGAGSAVGALSAGLLWQSVGPAWTYSFASACAACGLLLLLWRGKLLPRIGEYTSTNTN